MKENITTENLEEISKRLGVVEFHNQSDFRNNSNYNGILIQRIKEYLFDDKDDNSQKYLKKAQNAFHNESYSAAQMYIDICMMKSYNNKKLIQEVQYFALKIYERLSSNEKNAKKMLDETIQLSKKINLIQF